MIVSVESENSWLRNRHTLPVCKLSPIGLAAVNGLCDVLTVKRRASTQLSTYEELSVWNFFDISESWFPSGLTGANELRDVVVAKNSSPHSTRPRLMRLHQNIAAVVAVCNVKGIVATVLLTTIVFITCHHCRQFSRQVSSDDLVLPLDFRRRGWRLRRQSVQQIERRSAVVRPSGLLR